MFVFMIIGGGLGSAVASTTNGATDKSVEQLQAEVNQIKQQLIVIMRNQQAIAKHTGLIKETEKQALTGQPILTLGNSAIIGSAEAKLVLMEFTDLHCPFCKKFHDNTFSKLKEKYVESNEVLFVGKHYPIVALHKNALIAAKALECARESQPQNQILYENAKAWLFKTGKKFDESYYSEFVQGLSLNEDMFNSCVTSNKVEQTINADLQLAKSIGMSRTPSFVIGFQSAGKVKNWKIIEGAKTFEQFSDAIDKFIATAQTKD